MTGISPDTELVLNHRGVHTMTEQHVEDVGRAVLTIVVSRTLPLAEAAAHALIENRRALGRVVLIP